MALGTPGYQWQGGNNLIDANKTAQPNYRPDPAVVGPVGNADNAGYRAPVGNGDIDSMRANAPDISGLNTAWSQAFTNAAPSFAALHQSTNADAANLMAQAEYRNQLSGFAQNDYNNSLAKLGLNRSTNAADMSALGANQGIYDQMRGINNLQKGFANEQLGNTQNFANQTLQNFLAQNNLATAQAAQHAQSARIQGGGGMAGGTTVGIGQAKRGSELTAQDKQISTAERLAQALVQNKQALSEQDMANLRLDINANNDKAQMTKLQATADSYGIDAADLKNQLQQGLAKSGLDKVMGYSDLEQLATSANAQDQALYNKLVDEFVSKVPAGTTPEQLAAFRQAHPYR